MDRVAFQPNQTMVLPAWLAAWSSSCVGLVISSDMIRVN